MDLNKYLYKYIGNRVDELFKEKQKSNAVLSEELLIPENTISNLRNGKVSDKNRYLLTNGIIDTLSSFFQLEIDELLFGDIQEKERLVKHLMIILLVGGTSDNELINPYVLLDDFYEKVEYNAWLQDIKKYSSLVTYPYADIAQEFIENNIFFDSNKAEDFTLINSQDSSSFTASTCVLIKNIIIYDERLTYNYFEEILKELNQIVFPNNGRRKFTDKDIEYLENQINSILNNTINYGFEFIDPNKRDYILFIPAFDRYWTTHKTMYMDFFEEKLFGEISNTDGILMKKLQYGLVTELIEVNEFEELVNSIYEKDKYHNSTTSKNYLIFERKIILNIEKLKLIKNPDCQSSYFELLNFGAK